MVMPPSHGTKDEDALSQLLAAGALRFERTDDYSIMYARCLQAVLLSTVRRNVRTEAELRNLHASNSVLLATRELSPIDDEDSRTSQ